MEKAILNQPHFKDESKARQWLEAVRWPLGPVCPHCGAVSKDHYKLEGQAHRHGLYKCKDCREQFTVTVGTVFERSKVKLHVWLQAMQLMGSSKKGISSKQLERMLGVTYQTAWFMSHRIREAMKAPVSPQHLQRYATEFDFRYNHRETKVKDADGKWVKAGHSDAERTVELAKGIGGKRLTYRASDRSAA